MGTRRPAVSDTELDVLKAVWEHGPCTVREANAALRRRGRRWAYTTVLTLLQRLEAKGYVRSDKSETAHVFAATVSRDALLQQRLRELADELCKGTATPLLLALVENHRFTAEEIAQFRHLLDELAQQKPKRE